MSELTDQIQRLEEKRCTLDFLERYLRTLEKGLDVDITLSVRNGGTTSFSMVSVPASEL